MFRTYAKGRSNRKIRDPVTAQDTFYEQLTGLGVRQSFTNEEMKDRAAGIFGLKFLLMIECFYWVIRKIYR